MNHRIKINQSPNEKDAIIEILPGTDVSSAFELQNQRALRAEAEPLDPADAAWIAKYTQDRKVEYWRSLLDSQPD